MNIRKWRLVYISLSCIGVLALMLGGYKFFAYEADAIAYAKNCKLVKPGMTLREAKTIMGDEDWTKKKNRSDIWLFSDKDGKPESYCLDYPARFGSSGNPQIYFNPTSGIITKVECGQE